MLVCVTMLTFKLIQLTHGAAIVEHEGKRYNVNGEGYTDGRWEIFPKMVYQPGADGNWELINDEQRKAEIVAALREHWHEYFPPEKLYPNDDCV